LSFSLSPFLLPSSQLPWSEYIGLIT
jgi:hypothetical protein